jgi:hypothetical protein
MRERVKATLPIEDLVDQRRIEHKKWIALCAAT